MARGLDKARSGGYYTGILNQQPFQGKTDMKVLVSTAIILFGVLLASCASTQQARKVQTDSFLAPYKALLVQDDSGKRAILHYNDPNADWASYRKMQLEPVLLLSDPKTELSADQKAQLQKMVDNFYVALYKNLSRVFTMVQTPGPGALQLQVAVSHGEPSQAGLSLVSKIPGPTRILSTLWGKVSGQAAFSGGVTLEVVIKDAQSGKLLAAAADRRVGKTGFFEKGSFDSWGDVKYALEFYSQAIAFKLCKARGGDNCVKPE